jgi:hypothetical protein
MRYALVRKSDNYVIPGVGWKKKSHAEAWIQRHIELCGGLDWRIGGLFKAKNDNPLEVVYSKSLNSVPWVDVIAAPVEEYDPNE